MNSLCKSERLCGKTLFEELLTPDLNFVKYPYRILVKRSSEKNDFPVRIGISVSKKKFKRAVKRNRLKRLTREAFRCNKSQLYEILGTSVTLDILFIYIDNTLTEYPKIEKSMQNALQKIAEYFSKTDSDAK